MNRSKAERQSTGTASITPDDAEGLYNERVQKVTAGRFKGRIGYVDDDDVDKPRNYIVYFGRFSITPEYHSVPSRYLLPVTTPDLLGRSETIQRHIKLQTSPVSVDPADLLLELDLINATLYDRLQIAQFHRKEIGKRVFLSHSSKDKQFVKCIAIDLANAGHRPWLDEWEIRVGESIPTKVGEAVEQADAVAVVLSQNAVESRWVEAEWQTKYWRELSGNKTLVLPLFYQDCTIPTLLATKRYADFRTNYRDGLRHLLVALQ